MADINLGDVVARLRLDTTELTRGLAQAQQALAQLAQTLQAGLGQATQRTTAAQTQQAQATQQVTAALTQQAQATQQTTATQTRQTQTTQQATAAQVQQVQATQQVAAAQTQQAQATQQVTQRTSAMNPVIAQATQALQFYQAMFQQLAQQQGLTQFAQGMQALGLATAQTSTQFQRLHPLVLQNLQLLQGYQNIIRGIQSQQGMGLAPLIGSLGGGLSGIGGALGGLLGPLEAGIGVFAGRMASQLKDLGVEAVQTAARFQDLARSMTAVVGSAQAASAVMAQLFQTAQRAGVDFEQTVDGFRRLMAASEGTGLSMQTMLRANDNLARGFRVMGLSTEESHRAIVTWEQILTKGRLTAEETVRQLANAVPGGLNILSTSLHMNTERFRVLSEAGIIPTTLAFVAFTNEVGRRGGDITKPIEGLTTTFKNLRNETLAWLTAIGEGIGLYLKPFLDTISEISKQLRELYGIKPPGAGGGASTAGGMPESLAGLLGSTFQRSAEMWGNILGLSRRDRVVTPETNPTLVPMAQAAAQRAGIPEQTFLQMIDVESGFKPGLQGRPVLNKRTGRLEQAQGPGQMMPSTAAGEFGVTDVEALRNDAALNLDLSARLFARYRDQIRKRFGQLADETKLTLAAYNHGIGNVINALESQERRGQPVSYAAIESRLPGETTRYVQRISAMTEQAQGAAGTPPGAAVVPTASPGPRPFRQDEIDATIVKWQQYITDVQIARVEMDKLAGSSANIGDIFDSTIRKGLTNAVDKLIEMQQALVAMPDLAAQIPDALRQQIAEETRITAMSNARVLSQQQLRDLAKQQVEMLDQTRIQQQAQLTGMLQGQEAAERERRAAMQAMQQRRIADQEIRAGMTVTAQIERDRQRAQQLEAENQRLGAQISARQLQTRRPELEAELQRLEEFTGRAGLSDPARAREAARVQGEARRAEIQTRLLELQRMPGAGDLVTSYQQQLEAMDTAITANANKAFRERQEQQRAELRQTAEGIEQVLLRIGAAGMRPLDAEIARIQREYAQMTATLEDFLAKAAARRPKMEAPEQAEQDRQVALAQAGLAQMTTAQQVAENLAREKQAASMQTQLREAQDAAEQFTMRLSAGGLRPLEADLARIRLEFAKMAEQMVAVIAKLQEARKGATTEQQAIIDQLIKQFQGLQGGVEPGMERALEERRTRAGRERIQGLEDELARLNTPTRREGFPTELPREQQTRFQKAEEASVTEEQRKRIGELREAILAQEQLNYEIDVFRQLGQSVASAWSGVMQKIFEPAQDNTERVMQMTEITGKLATAQQHLSDLRMSQARINREALSSGAQEQMRQAMADSEKSVRVLEAQRQALQNVSHETNRVAAAFREMARSILQSMAQIATNEAFKMLMGIGSQALRSWLGATTPTQAGEGAHAAAFGTQSFPAGAFGGDEDGGGGAGSTAIGAVSAVAGIASLFFQHGGYVNKPTMAILGEAGGEYVVPEYKMANIIGASMRAGAANSDGGGVSIHNHPNKESAERGAAQDRAAGRQAIVNEVLSDLNRGESSQIQQVLRRTAR